MGACRKVGCGVPVRGRAVRGLEGYKRLHQDAPRATVRSGSGWRGSTVQGAGIRRAQDGRVRRCRKVRRSFGDVAPVTVIAKVVALPKVLLGVTDDD